MCGATCSVKYWSSWTIPQMVRRPPANRAISIAVVALVRMHPAERHQARSPVGGERQPVEVDAVIHGGDVVQPGGTVGIGDRHVGRPRGRTRAGFPRRRKRGPWLAAGRGNVRRTLTTASPDDCAGGRTRPSGPAYGRRAWPPTPDRPHRVIGISPGHTPSRRAEVTESRMANNVTSTPRATRPSASRPVTCSHGP